MPISLRRASAPRPTPSRSRVAALLALASAAALGAAPAGALATEPLRAKDDYAVGKRTLPLVDASRPTKANGGRPATASRQLPTLVLYPAAGTPGTAAVEGRRPVRRRGGFPLIVFAHGFTASGPAYQFLLERFVRQGYVVAAPTFPLSNGSAPGGPTGSDYSEQPADVSFVIDRVIALARREARFSRTISTTRIGAMGHSLGAITTLGVAASSCCLDRRIDAAVAISGIQLPFPRGAFFPRSGPPLMLVHGTKDATVPYAGSTSAYTAARVPKVLLSLEDAGHVPFVAPWLDPTVRATTDFLDGYLERDDAALRRLGADGDVAGVASVEQDLGDRRR